MLFRSSSTPKDCSGSMSSRKRHATSLLCLPTEILFIIVEFLSPAERGTLMLSCRYLRKSSCGVFASLVWPEVMPSKEYRFEILRMVERDGLLQSGKQPVYCCWGCLKTHEKTHFSREEFCKHVDQAIAPTKDHNSLGYSQGRYCLKTKKCIRYGFNGQLSFLELRKLFSNSWISRCLLEPSGTSVTIFCPILRVLIDSWPLFHNDVGIINFDQFSRLCRTVKFPVCPHIRFDDEELLQRARGSFIDGLIPFDLAEHRECLTVCTHCQTKVSLHYNHKSCFLVVTRHFYNLSSPLDRDFLSKAVSSQDPRLDAHAWNFAKWTLRLRKEARNYGLTGKRCNLQEFVPDTLLPDFDALFTPVTPIPPDGMWKKFKGRVSRFGKKFRIL